MVNDYFIFFTNLDGEEELGGSHYNFDHMIQIIEMFLRTNKEREFLFVSACRKKENGEMEEVVRWKNGTREPVLDLRSPEWLQDARGRVY